MALIRKTLFGENLDRYNTFVQDTDTNSKYFKITELPDTFTGGKNAFLIQGSEYLVADTLIKIELKDSSGNIIYHEPGEGYFSSSLNDESGKAIITEYYEGVSKVVAVYVYPETAFGPCTLTILGELSEYDNNGLLTPIPVNWQGQYNVKWQKQINVNPSLSNTTKIRFYQRPVVTINEIISPIFRIENGVKINSGINQSFANIKLSKLETFAGDVKRVKVFRTSQGDISDFDLIQDILVESKELLTTTELSGSVVGNTGIFTSETLKNFWNTGSLNTELTSSRIESGVKLTGNGNFRYTSSLDLKSANTYELNLDAFYSSSTSSNLGIYISGSDGGNVLISTLNGITPTKNLLDTVIPFKLDSNFQSGSLYFSQSQGEWHLGNISLRLSEDTAFSPDEISFITTMPTVIGNEDFNFKFEFYDVNNNFVPVLVTGSANFTGGSNAITKLLTFESDRTAFRFSTGSFANPPNQSVGFKTIKTNFTGSITYASSAFDVGGTYIQPSSYAGTYPGAFVSQNDNGALLNIASFSGSVATVLVGSIVYTASCEGFQEYETIYRFEDGDNAPGVFVTANTNQFIYKATDLSLNPTGQVITIEAKRKNLASATTPLTVNSGSGKPPLTLVSTNATNGVDTYTLAGSSYSYGVGESIYYISGSDQFGNQFSDSVKISPVKILDGLSATLTNDNASLPALSNGFVASGSFLLTSGSVTVKVGNESISFDDDNDSVRANNTFAITNLSGTGCTPNGGAGSNPSINGYGITNLTADSGSLDITISYKDGAGDTTSIVKTATYTKNKKAAPVLEFIIGNNNQSTDAKSTGEQITAFANSSLSVKEQYNGVASTLTLVTAPTINSSSAFTTITKTTTNLTYPTMISGTDSVELSITGSVTDSEGVSRNVFGNVSLTKIKKAAPVLSISSTPKDQSVTAKSTGAQIDSFANATIVVKETYNGATTTLPVTLTATRVDTGGSLTVNNTTGVVTLTNQTLADGINSTTVNISAIVTDSEGTSRTLTDTLSLSKVKKAAPVVVATLSKDGQSITKTNTGVYGTPVTFTISVNEGSTNYTYSTGGGINTYQISLTGGTGTTTITPTIPTTDAGTTVAITITYVNSEGTTGTITKEHKVNVTIDGNNGANGSNGTNGTNGTNGANGGDGPGVVFRGPWSAATTYNSISQDATRRDVVLYSGIYYATKANATANLNKQPDTQTTFWQVLGNGGDSFFVAAEMFISKESYVQNTINVGTNGSGNANITIAGGTTSPYISIGQATKGYDQTGAFLGSNGTTGRLSLKGTGGSLLWDGNNLTVNGGGTFSGALSAASGTFTGALSGGTISIGSGDSIFKADSNGIYLGNATFASAPFRVTPAGALTASSANITGVINATSGVFSGPITSTATITGGTISGGTISGGTITIGANFSVDNSGNMVANNASMTGQVTATGGSIGGWTINGTQLIGSGSAGRIILDPAIPSVKFNNVAGATKLTIRTGQLTYLGGNQVSISMPSQTTGPGTFYTSVYSETVGTMQTIYIPDAGNYIGTPSFSGNGSNLYYTSPTFNGYFSVNFWIEIKDGPTYATAATVGYISVGGDTTYGVPNETGVMGLYPYVTTLSFPTAGNFYLFPVRAITGNFTSGYVQLAGGGYTGGSSNFNPEVDFGELTEYGLQVATSATQYAKIARNSSYAFEALGSISVTSPAGQFSYFNGVIHPMVGNTNDLGSTGNRWRTVWTNNALNSTSDERLKNSIEDTDLGLEFVNKLRPVKYKNNAATSPRYHYGLIAQEMIGTLNDFNKTTSDVGFIASSSLSYTEEDIKGWKKREDWPVWESEISASMQGELGLAYTELISPMIKAIQQLSAKVEELEAKISGSI